FGDAEVDVHKLIYKPKNTLEEQNVDWDELRKRAEETHVEIVPKHPAPDVRYNVPKAAPNASQADVDAVIEANPIYREVREGSLDAQRRQVAYGLDKYPEPLNASTWTTIETIDHIISETQDKLHY